MSNKSKGSDTNKGAFVTDGASVPTKLIKRGAGTPVKPKPKPTEK
jgi:hypothetical protein